MAVNTCLRRTFIFVDVVLGVLGIIWIARSLFLHGNWHSHGQAYNIKEVIDLYVCGVEILVLCTVGLHGIRKNKKWALIVFSAGMILVSLQILVFAIYIAAETYMVEQDIKSLNLTLPEDSNWLIERQAQFQCCGLLNGVQDWEDVVPTSCHCPDTLETSAQQCIGNVTRKETNTFREILVYKQPCFPFLVDDARKHLGSEALFYYIYLICMVVGPGLSITILRQMRGKAITPPVTYTTCASDRDFRELR